MMRTSVLYGYRLPFVKGGVGLYLKTLLLSLVPLAGGGAYAFAYPRCEGQGAFARFWRMLWLNVRLFLPATALVLLALLAVWLQLPLAFGYAFLALAALCLVSAAVRMPMALAVVAAGGRVGHALKRGYVKGLIQACFGKYLLLLAGMLPFAVAVSLCGLLPPVPRLIIYALLSAWFLLYTGCGAAACLEQSAGSPPPRPARRARRRTVAAALLVVALLPMLLPPPPARAEGDAVEEINRQVERIKHDFSLSFGNGFYIGSIKESFKAAYDRFVAGSRSAYATASNKLGVMFDLTPVLSDLKNVYEFLDYRDKAGDPTLTQEQRSRAEALMYYKAAELGLPLVSKLKPVGWVFTGIGVAADKLFGSLDEAYARMKNGASSAYAGVMGGLRRAYDGLGEGMNSVYRAITGDETGTAMGDEMGPPISDGTQQRAPSESAACGVYQCTTTSRSLITGETNTPAMLSFLVSQKGTGLVVCPCFANGDYVDVYTVAVAYDETIGAYHGRQTRGSEEKGDFQTCEYIVHFAHDEQGVVMNAQCDETTVSGGSYYHYIYYFSNGRLISARPGQPISLEEMQRRGGEAAPTSAPQGGMPVGSFNP